MKIKVLFLAQLLILSVLNVTASQEQFSGNISYELTFKPSSKWGLFEFVTWSQNSGVQPNGTGGVRSKNNITGTLPIVPSQAIVKMSYANPTAIYCGSNVFIDNSASKGGTNIFLLGPANADNEYEKYAPGSYITFGNDVTEVSVDTAQGGGTNYWVADPVIRFGSILAAANNGVTSENVNQIIKSLQSMDGITNYFDNSVFTVYFNSTLNVESLVSTTW